jgi:hypothetical protein
MATKKISQLVAATGVAGADLVPIVQGGVTKRATVSLLAAAGATGPTGSAGQSIVGPTGPAGAGESYVQANAPESASDGATWFDTDNGKYYVRYDGLWVETGFQPEA